MNSQGKDPSDCCASPGLISVEQAIEKILSQAGPVEQTETVEILDALNRVLAEDLHSGIDVPGYDNSAMDGYAVRSEDCQTAGAELPVTQRIPAGQVGGQLEAGSAARIFTGAPVPQGADAVVMQERCESAGDRVTINTVVKAGANIRRAGEDIEQGSVILKKGTNLRQQELGLIASVGIANIPVYRKLRVACFFTGDELVEPGNKLHAGKIYNSNRYTLNGFLQTQNCEIADFGIVPDTLEATLDVIQKASEKMDLIITSGGVSVGEEDYVRIALEQLGKLELWRIAMKPGKPVAFGKVGQTLFLGLPGNPVAVFVTAQIFACPLIRKLQGRNEHFHQIMTAKSGFDWPAVKRQEYLRVQLIQQGGEAVAQLYPHQGSGVLSSASWANGLVIVPVDQAITVNDTVDYIALL